MEMSLSRALVELKTITKRINDSIQKFSPTDVMVGGKLKTNQTLSEFEKNVKADFQSITDLISRRSKIKSAVVKANALTTVTIAGTTMTIAEAIERKNSISLEQSLHRTIQLNFMTNSNQMEQMNLRAQDRLDKLLEATFSKDSSKVKPDEYDAVAKPFMEKNFSTMVDPLNVREVIKKLDDNIIKFLQEVDIILSEANASTMIEIN